MRKWDFEGIVTETCHKLKKYAEARGVKFKVSSGTKFGDGLYVSWELEDDDWYDCGLAGFYNIESMGLEEAFYRIQKELERRVRITINNHVDILENMDEGTARLETIATSNLGFFRETAMRADGEHPIVLIYIPDPICEV